MPRKKPKTPNLPWTDLGAPPLGDSVATVRWAFEAMAVTMFKVMGDLGIDESARRKELRETAGAMRGLIPTAELHQARDVVEGDQRNLSDARTGPELEDASHVTGARGRPAAKRGRPRKRPLP